METQQTQQLTYTWWKVFSFLFIIPHSIFIISTWMGFFNIAANGMAGEFIAVVALTIAIMLTWLIALLSLGKYAFILATFFSLNPIFWIVNTIYLKNRWKNLK